MPALTVNVNNLVILKHTPPILVTFPKIYRATISGMTAAGPIILTFPWQPYFDRHVFRNFQFLAFVIRIFPFSLSVAPKRGQATHVIWNFFVGSILLQFLNLFHRFVGLNKEPNNGSLL